MHAFTPSGFWRQKGRQVYLNSKPASSAQWVPGQDYVERPRLNNFFPPISWAFDVFALYLKFSLEVILKSALLFSRPRLCCFSQQRSPWKHPRWRYLILALKHFSHWCIAGPLILKPHLFLISCCFMSFCFGEPITFLYELNIHVLPPKMSGEVLAPNKIMIFRNRKYGR